MTIKDVTETDIEKFFNQNGLVAENVRFIYNKNEVAKQILVAFCSKETLKIIEQLNKNKVMQKINSTMAGFGEYGRYLSSSRLMLLTPKNAVEIMSVENTSLDLSCQWVEFLKQTKNDNFVQEVNNNANNVN